MASAAVVLGRNVICRFRRSDTRGMASGAVVLVDSCVAVQDSSEAAEIADVMAVRAIQIRRHVIPRLSRADAAVVTGSAVAGVYADVIEDRTLEVNGIVANDAVFRRRQVIIELADRDHVVVTEGAVIDHTKMIIATCAETARGVTDTAVFRGRHVIRRLPACGDSVTGSAIVDDAGMVENAFRKTVCVVAHPAIFARRRMGRHGGRLARSTDAVVVGMAGSTGLH